jgi:hypothetical protein
MTRLQKTPNSSLRTSNSGAKNLAPGGLAYNLNTLLAKGCIERIGVGRAIRYRATGKAYTRWGK